MSLRERLGVNQDTTSTGWLYRRFGILANPFPAANQTAGNPHWPTEADDEAEARIETFWRDGKSQVVVVEGTQGVGKTNFLNHFESEIRTVLNEQRHYLVRYLADLEPSFDGITRRLFEELGVDHLAKLSEALGRDSGPISEARSPDMREALSRLSQSPSEENFTAMMDWLLGLRLLASHRKAIGVQFRLDTVESKLAALRDLIHVSGNAGILDGVFLLLDELEKQGGLTPRPLVRYLSAIRSMIDALPTRLFLMMGVTPDALRRFKVALPALRGRLQSQITLSPLVTEEEAVALEGFYVNAARLTAQGVNEGDRGDNRNQPIVSPANVRSLFAKLLDGAEQRGDRGVTQRDFLHELHLLAERAIQQR